MNSCNSRKSILDTVIIFGLCFQVVCKDAGEEGSEALTRINGVARCNALWDICIVFLRTVIRLNINLSMDILNGTIANF